MRNSDATTEPETTQEETPAPVSHETDLPLSLREQRLLERAHTLASEVDAHNTRLAEAGYGADRAKLLNARDALRYEIEQSYPDWQPPANEPLPE